MKEFWDDRYGDPEYAYGTAPNTFFERALTDLKPGSMLLPGDGEGRNGVHAARMGWEVTSADLSAAGKAKALTLAQSAGVSLNYLVGDIEDLDFEPASFDAIALIYAHFAADRKPDIHQQLNAWLKPGGILILEAFRKAHLQYNAANPYVGGPKELKMLYSPAELHAGFPDHDLLLLEEPDVDLQEGKYHAGRGAVIRYIGRKQSV